MDQQPNSVPPAPEPVPQSNTNVMPARKPKGWMITSIILIVVVVAMSAFGYYKWKQYRTLTGQLGAQINALQNQVTELQAQVASLQSQNTTKSTTVSSDQALINAAVAKYRALVAFKNPVAKIQDQSGDFAHVEVHDDGVNGTSRVAIFKKVNGIWVYVWGGTESPGKDIGVAYGLPSGWYVATQATSAPTN